MLDRAFYSLPHVIEAQQFQKKWIQGPFIREATEMEAVVATGGSDILRKKRMMTVFYEPSTRTRFSFELAMSNLGGEVFHTENAGEFSSAIKGETLEDTIRVLCGYKPSVIVLRHGQDGAAAIATKVSGSVAIMNAGDGGGQHPTQALLDVLTIWKEIGCINSLSIAMVGDLSKGRTVRSLSYLLGKFEGIKIHFVSPPCARMNPDIKAYLERHLVRFSESSDLRLIAGQVDVIYQTRTQKERGSHFDRNDRSLGYFDVNEEILGLMKKHAIIMHPLPRVDEIDPKVDRDPRAAYFRQAENGLYTRMALLKMALAPKA
ncbi:MAG: aspartate carbamoyltransferase [Candidatus Staskawiczbacteria bacterium]|nr:aspartate carbamoyltransferase [Candidatus Staskawiczbacteria bacterium]